MKLKKTFKKVLSVVLALAMVVTSITVYNTTAKADEASKLSGVSIYNTQAYADTSVLSDARMRGFYDKASDTAKWGLGDEDAILDEAVFAFISPEGAGVQSVTIGDVTYEGKTTDVAIGGDCIYINQELLQLDDENTEKTFVISVSYGEDSAKNFSFDLTIKPYEGNKDLNLKVDRTDENNKLVFLAWDLIDGAIRYDIYDGETVVKQANAGATWEQIQYEYGKTYNFTVKAISETGEIEIINNTVSFSTEIPDNFDAALSVVYGEDGTATLSWKEITGATKYQVTVDDTVVDVDGTTYKMDAEANVLYNVSVKALDENDAEIEITNSTAEVKYIPEAAPEENDIDKVDVSGWTKIDKKGTKPDAIIPDYSINNAGYALIRTYFYGIYNPHVQKDENGNESIPFHDQRGCQIPVDVPAFVFQSKAGYDNAAKCVWVNQKKYPEGAHFNHQGDCMEIATDVLVDGLNVVTIVYNDNTTDTFAIKVEAPKPEEAPDQNIDTPTDWVQVGNVATADGKYVYMVSEAYRDSYIPYTDLLGLYTDHTSSPWHPAGCTLTDAAYVFALHEKDAFGVNLSSLKSVWIDGEKITDETKCYLDGNQIHLSQSLFAAVGDYKITVRDANTGDYTYMLRVAEAKTVKLDGAVITTVAKGTEYTFTDNGKNEQGYTINGVNYKAGNVITVDDDIEATSIDVKLVMNDGASVKLTNPTGIRFMTTVDSNVENVEYGTLIARSDKLTDDAELTTETADVVNVKTENWVDEAKSAYIAALVNISIENIDTTFAARAYATITYADGTTGTVYSDVTAKRNVSYVLNSLGLTTDDLVSANN